MKNTMTPPSHRPFKAKFPTVSAVEAFRSALESAGLDSPFFNITISGTVITMESSGGVPTVIYDQMVPLLKKHQMMAVDF